MAFCVFTIAPQERFNQLRRIVHCVSNPGFPEPETRFFLLFSTTRNPFFSTAKPGYIRKTGIAVAFKY